MEGSLSLNVGDDISLHMDHKVHGQHRPCTVFLSCSEGRIGIGINIIGKPHHDDVGLTIEKGRLVTVTVKPVHAFNKTFCIDGPASDLDHDKTEGQGITIKEAAKNLAEMALFLKTSEGKVKEVQDQLDLEVKVAAENDWQLRDQLASQHQELDRLRGLEKQYRDIVTFFKGVKVSGDTGLTACQEMVDETEELIKENQAAENRQLRAELQGMTSAVEQIEQKRKNEQGSRIYYQELVQTIRAVVVQECEQTRGCSIDALPAFVKAAVKIARQNGLGQAIANIKGHHHG